MTSKVMNAYSSAREILDTIGISRMPVSLPKIARNLNINIEYAPLDDELSGMAFVRDGEKHILTNSLHHPNRQRFTIAHEIGHHVLHAKELLAGVHVDKGILRRDTISSEGSDRMEIEANAFASELLMPTAAVSEALGQDFDLDDSKKVEQLAKRFKVSNAAMQHRLMRR